MLKRSIGALVLVSVLVLLGTPALAHHSFAAIFDKEQPITVTGVINKVDWKNPHMYFYVDVTEEDGEVVTWGFESYPPTMMIRQGWARDTVNPGDPVTVTGWRARRGSRPVAAGNRMTLADGRVMTIGATSEREN
jgi:hypothetical protein